MDTATRRFRPRRTLILAAAVFAGLVGILVIAAGVIMARMSDVPSGLDYSTNLVTEQGTFKVSYTPENGAIPINQIHRWTLHAENGDGHPVIGARIEVDGDMPQHGHGLPTRPRVTKELGSGDYLVEGLKFQMVGWWVMDFTIHANGSSDTVRFNLMLEP